jgi:hypothetical protein
MGKLLWEREGGVVFEGTLGRRYDLTFGVELTPRNEHGRKGGAIAAIDRDGDGEICLRWGTKPAMRVAFESLEKDYDLTAFVIAGDALPPVPPERIASSVPEVVEIDGYEGLATVDVDGDRLEVVELDGEGWVSLGSLCRPFGKDPKEQRSILGGWARTRRGRLTTRGGVQDALLLHHKDAPMFVARLNARGMNEETRSKHQRYLRLCADVLGAYFTRTAPATTPALAPSGDDRIGQALLLLTQQNVQHGQALEQLGGITARAAADAAAAKTAAQEARAIAEEARTVAARVSSSPTAGMEPGVARRVPEGVVVSDAPSGFDSMRKVAYRFQLPRIGEGANFVARVADALKVDEIDGATWRSAVVAGGHEVRSQRRFGPIAVDHMRPGLLAAAETMRLCGYEASTGVLRPVGAAARSKGWVIQQMLEAAAGAAVPSRVQRGAGESGDRQTSIPGVGNDTQPKAS